MIINPSVHAIVPRTKSFAGRSRRWRRQAFNFSFGGKQFCFAVAKMLCGFGAFVFLSSLWLGSNIDHANSRISKIEMQHEQLVTANILLRAKKARLFSPEIVGVMAGDQLAIHLPSSGQYKQL